MKKIPRILSIACLSLLSVILAFVVLEIAATVYLLHWADEDRFLLYASLNQLQERKETDLPKFTSHRYLGYQLTPNYVRVRTGTTAWGIGAKR